ncbi:hypothetical protein ACFSHT_22440 [Paraburkholderia silviterrae]|uniref:Uncharacterized protein n=1 Tax=Paraburkholderia silviterrae TaxID=2528715 RepID=A0A4R5MGI4_9BURK|nr:hypothetical protein [Paraburkholderia silviterrae]TDG25860.1 hypothetical protein EYW47_00370 [Paraburkholderia silviterrae]
MSFSEYPKAMKHPAHRAAVLSKDEVVNGKIIKAPPGSPEKFPDVFVNNADQEQQYAALGYVPNGVSDPEAYRRAMTNNEEPAGHQHHEYPRYLYQPHASGEHEVSVGADTVAVRSVLVNHEAAHKALRGEWFETPMHAAEAALAPTGADLEEEEDLPPEDPPTNPDVPPLEEQQAPRNKGGRPRKNPEVA